MHSKSRVKDQKNADHYIWGSVCDGWHYFRSDELSVIRECMPPHTSETLHYHTKSQQFFYVLSGEAGFIIGDETFKVNAGQGISIAPGEHHRIMNNTDAPLEFVVISSPKSHGDRIEVE